ncbi:conserved hypothetical protein [Leishmania infantum JPCM5]|uniref:Afadin-_and_alpha_-actinin-Binding_-_putative n=2 Tax=Leishmania infantum TaxID=5671 RepID=A0A6L0Y1N5_LEIIN|nr:conserved hypothetical protein [Leishmania infantum JPCM5]CAC9548617.1 Afadin-_and_alpha_-actinin-Binding_-_putative [Leishmania infantum]CAM72692.1 conserved hypothetical protein [Leishmania infantum JPCM5]SUZ46395.1 Afadin-_and_alpha_-actinin-Binding_-_putative [Leishmania infantum]|eukprot:XP_001469582.1 conserved hypothetical protein [Leishmania infantum JPCM5]
MLFDSDDDNLPEVPTIRSNTLIPLKTSGAQAQRLQQLEAEYRASRAETAAVRQRAARRCSSSRPVSPPEPRKAASHVWEERDEAAFYELHSLVPHLSPQFACSYSDAVLLIAAIQSGGAASGNRHTLADKCQSLEADRRQLEQRLEKSRAQCEELKREVAEVKQKLRVVQEESRNSVNALAQRREEMRKQLLLEETRAEKLMVRNKKLEQENDSLKGRVREQFR